MPSLGLGTQLRVFVEPDVLQEDEALTAVGTWNDNFVAEPGDIVCVAGRSPRAWNGPVPFMRRGDAVCLREEAPRPGRRVPGTPGPMCLTRVA